MDGPPAVSRATPPQLVAHGMVAAHRGQEHGATRSPHNEVDLETGSIVASGIGPQSIQEPILIEIEKGEQRGTLNVEHVGEGTESAVTVIEVEERFLCPYWAGHNVLLAIHVQVDQIDPDEPGIVVVGLGQPGGGLIPKGAIAVVDQDLDVAANLVVPRVSHEQIEITIAADVRGLDVLWLLVRCEYGGRQRGLHLRETPAAVVQQHV